MATTPPHPYHFLILATARSRPHCKTSSQSENKLTQRETTDYYQGCQVRCFPAKLSHFSTGSAGKGAIFGNLATLTTTT